ncbi:MAG: HlyC/CorC family transporter [Candidatus Eisenbacteria bacterium]|uniref:HlyC/CorC family transporter n=1 Tax=Eiseniibacteriota bacterium TaxID=2212470 RepID=A0A938BN71_UNCEI|nr:HlyC/CorC family transporter [Candidatus Eisenbacteria bacterium]
MTALLLPLALIGLLLGISAYFSAAEMALLSANQIRLRHRAQEGDAGARRALRLLGHRDQVLTLCFTGAAAANVLAAAIATIAVDRLMRAPWMAPLVVTLGLTAVVVVAAEILPKVVARKRATAMLARDSRLLDFLHHLAMPLTGLIQLYVRALRRLSGRRHRAGTLTRDELRLLVREAVGDSEEARSERRMLSSLLDFRDTVAREVMIPMNRIVALERGASTDAWRATVRAHGYTRLPVYEDQRDRVVGLVNAFDLLYDPQRGGTVDAYMRPIPIVPDSKRIDHLLVELQKTRSPMAVVVDEFGSCEGIVTVEDIAEEIVGEMADEHERPPRTLRRVGPDSFILDGLMDVDDADQELGLQLPRGRYDTIGGMILKRAGRVPRIGERFTIAGAAFEVLEATPYGVLAVKVTLPGGHRAGMS